MDPNAMRNTPAIPNAGVIVGSHGKLSSCFASLDVSVPLLATKLVAEGLDGIVDEERDTEVDLCSDDVALGREDSASSVDLVASEVTVPLVEEADSVEVFGESVVRLGKLDSLPVVPESCRTCREALSGLDAPKGITHPKRDSKIT
jgi:hypothetical protein